jgi:hypothetical protein
MRIGACGLACGVCRLYLEKKCVGCLAGTKVKRKPRCQILECAWKRKVAFCPKDCREFPCFEFYEGKGRPLSKERLNYFKKKLRAG